MNIEIKFFQNYIQTKKEGVTKKYPVGYYMNSLEDEITIYSDSYDKGFFGKDLPDFFKTENNSDSQVDYFEKTRMKIKKENSYFEDAKKAMMLKKMSYEKRIQKAKEKQKKLRGGGGLGH